MNIILTPVCAKVILVGQLHSKEKTKICSRRKIEKPIETDIGFESPAQVCLYVRGCVEIERTLEVLHQSGCQFR